MGAVSRKDNYELTARAYPVRDLIVGYEGAFQISLRVFHAAKDVLCEFLIDSAPIAPCRCSIQIIEELIKTGDLCRFERLVRDQFSFQNPEDSSAKGRAWK